MTYSYWTPDEDKLLMELEGKMNIEEMVEILNRSKGAIYARRKKLGLVKPRKRVWNDEVEQKAIKMLNKGMSQKEISLELKINPITLRDNLIKIGVISVEEPKPPKKDTVRKNVLSKLKQGVEYRIIETYGHTYGTEFMSDHMLVNGRRSFVGKLVGQTDDFLIFDNGKFKECVSYEDIHTGSYKIKEV